MNLLYLLHTGAYVGYWLLGVLLPPSPSGIPYHHSSFLFTVDSFNNTTSSQHWAVLRDLFILYSLVFIIEINIYYTQFCFIFLHSSPRFVPCASCRGIKHEKRKRRSLFISFHLFPQRDCLAECFFGEPFSMGLVGWLLYGFGWAVCRH